MLRTLARWRSLFIVLAGIIVVGLLISRHIVGPGAGEHTSVGRISAEQAKEHVGARATVCGSVAEITQITDIAGTPTFINLEKQHPNQTFTAVIWAEDRRKWSPSLETRYADTTICIRGTIEDHDGIPQIEVSSPRQIRNR